MLFKKIFFLYKLIFSLINWNRFILSFVRSNNLSLKYQECTPLGCKDLDILTNKFVTKP